MAVPFVLVGYGVFVAVRALVIPVRAAAGALGAGVRAARTTARQTVAPLVRPLRAAAAHVRAAGQRTGKRLQVTWTATRIRVRRTRLLTRRAAARVRQLFTRRATLP